MSNPAKSKGTAFETAIVTYLREFFPEVSRLPLAGAKDIGDLRGVPGSWTLELKAYRNTADALRLGTRQAAIESANAGTEFHAAIIKQPRAAIRDAYVVMPLYQWAAIVADLNEGTP